MNIKIIKNLHLIDWDYLVRSDVYKKVLCVSQDNFHFGMLIKNINLSANSRVWYTQPHGGGKKKRCRRPAMSTPGGTPWFIPNSLRQRFQLGWHNNMPATSWLSCCIAFTFHEIWRGIKKMLLLAGHVTKERFQVEIFYPIISLYLQQGFLFSPFIRQRCEGALSCRPLRIRHRTAIWRVRISSSPWSVLASPWSGGCAFFLCAIPPGPFDPHLTDRLQYDAAFGLQFLAHAPYLLHHKD